MTPPDPDEGFKVTDRRRRDDPEDDKAASPPSTGTASAPVAAPQPSRASQPARPPDSARPSAGSPPSLATEPDIIDQGHDEEASLAGLFMMLGSSAVVALGEVADPMTGRRQDDPGQAAEIIDLLLLLRKKTEGNRTAEETQVLEELIYDLQLRYVEAMKRSG